MFVSAPFISILINFIIETYLTNANSICVLWNHKFPFELEQSNYKNYVSVISLYKHGFEDKSNIVAEDLATSTNFEEVLTESIYRSHCNSFIAFEDEIKPFVRSFLKSSIHSPWHAMNNKFLFVYTKGQFETAREFNHYFFADQSEVLFIEAVNKTVFDLKTTKFVGSRNEHPEQLIFLDRYYGDRHAFQFNHNLYPVKARNLQGRGLRVIGFTYPPFSIITNDTSKTNAMNIGDRNEDPTKRLAYDGVDSQVLFQFCRIYNCTIQVYLSRDEEWGIIYENFTGHGMFKLLLTRNADITMMASYMWKEVYPYLDMSNPISRAAVTCLVPKPSRLTTWYLALQPFQKLLWLSILGCLFLETVALVTARSCGKGESRQYTLMESLQFGYISTFKLFLSQSTSFLVNSVSVRLVLFSCYMIDIIITSTYGAGLATILTIPRLEEAPDTIERMIQQKLLWGGTTYDWLLHYNDVTEPSLVQFKNNFRLLPPDDLREKSLHDRFGFVMEKLQYGHFAVPPYIKRDAISRFKIMIEDMYSQYCVAFTQRSWPLMDTYNNFVIMAQSSGLMKYWETLVVRNFLDRTVQDHIASSASADYEELGPVPLGMENFAGIMLIWFTGMIVSLLSFAAELFLKLRK